MNRHDVDFYFDFGSPNAWIAHFLLPQISERSGIRFHYRPILLGGIFQLTGNRPPLQQFADIPAKAAWFRRELVRFVARHEVPFSFNPHFPVNTLKLMRGALMLQGTERFGPYLDLCFRHMWVQPKKLDDDALFATVLAEGGFDADPFFEAIARPEIKQGLIQATEAAVKKGVFGAPTFIAGDELYFGKDELLAMEVDLTRGG